jgi:hypothetical protein
MGSLTVSVVQVGSGEAVTDFRFLVNADNVGNPTDPDPANWPSLRQGPSHSPVIASGDAEHATVDLPDGNYLVTVRAPGHKLGGNWVRVSGDAAVTVALQPHPLPLSKIRVRVFHDHHPVNGEDDIPLEEGLPGFRVVLEDAVGEVTVDYFGNVLSLFTDTNGELVIENLAPGKYEVQAIPPDGTDWVQTTTIEGTFAIDAWIEEGNDGYTYEEGYRAPLVAIGFVRPMEFPVPAPGVPVGTVSGVVKGIIEFRPPAQGLAVGEPVNRPWVALTDIGNTDEQVFLGRGAPDGSFTIPNVPPGLYQLAVWDEPLDFIISFRTVRVGPGEHVDLDVVAVPRWFGQIAGTVFYDLNENGVRDPGEPGIPMVALGVRFKDGSIQYGTMTDMNGDYSFPEVYELEHFAVAELGFARFGPTGVVATPDERLIPPGPPTAYPANLLMAQVTGAGTLNRIDWGMTQYPQTLPDGSEIANGGITGVVYYATMRNETDPRFAAAEDYEPGIPHVTVNLYAPNPDGSLTLLQTVETDGWEQPTDCIRIDGTPDPLCIEVPRLGNQAKPAVFDGGFAFVDLAPGDYVVEVVPPPGYTVLAEGAENTSEGDVFLLGITTPPYYENARDKKLITLQPAQNATTDFFLYTEVPVPGRIIGLVSDDLNLETNPTSPYFMEKRPIPNSPVGIRDFTGRLLKTVNTDANGTFEVLLPSTYTANVPIPAGVAPGMYRIVGNDPGDPDAPNPNFNPDYQTLPLVFDVWPGKTTYADVAILPIRAFGDDPPDQPPGMQVEPGTPQVYLVDPVFAKQGRTTKVKLRGTGFGTSRGRVTLGGEPVSISRWTNTQIEICIPKKFPEGPFQLLITGTNGKVSPTGLTFHVLGDEYAPDVRVVEPGGSIQEAINKADDGDLIVVRPGTYYENLILYKNVKLQGMGWKSTIIDGRFFAQHRQAWQEQLNRVRFSGPGQVPTGGAITVVADEGRFDCDDLFRPQIDGFTITGARGEVGGGVLLNAYCKWMEISNNVIEKNGAGFAGAIAIGRPYSGDCHNDRVSIHHNRILGNGGISLAGAIGIFNGADHYEIAHNDIVGNYSAEYGGGISHMGLSQNGRIHHNRVLYNTAFDEGGGILVGGEQPKPPSVLSVGSGPVEIYANLVQGNLANDDGGGIRLLRAGSFLIRIYNNFIVNNVATDIGGGIALDDASHVVIMNNTIAKNATTATAEDSDRLPHGAGLVSENHSAPFQATLPPGSPPFSNPVLVNNLFWDNRAYHFDLVRGELAADFSVIDLEVFGTLTPAQMTPRYCYLSTPYGTGSGNVVYNGTNPPRFTAEYDTVLRAVAMRGQPEFIDVRIVTDGPALPGDYHLSQSSPAVGEGVWAYRVGGSCYTAADVDIDGDRRTHDSVDIGADQDVRRRDRC